MKVQKFHPSQHLNAPSTNKLFSSKGWMKTCVRDLELGVTSVENRLWCLFVGADFCSTLLCCHSDGFPASLCGSHPSAPPPAFGFSPPASAVNLGQCYAPSSSLTSYFYRNLANNLQVSTVRLAAAAAAAGIRSAEREGGRSLLLWKHYDTFKTKHWLRPLF